MVPIEVPAGKGPTWQERHRRDLQDLAALGVSLLVVGRITGDMPLPAALCALVTAGLIPLRSLKGPPTLWILALSALPRQAAAVLTTFLLLTFLIPHPPYLPVVRSRVACGCRIPSRGLDGVGPSAFARVEPKDPAEGPADRPP